MKIFNSKFESKQHFSFLAIGETQKSKEASEGGFKRYIGLGSSNVLAVNPSKEKLDELMGYVSQNEPEYVKETEEGKEAHIHVIVKTDPESNNGIEIVSRLMFTLRATPAYNRDKTKVEVLDRYGNHTWMDAEDAKNGKPALLPSGNPNKLDTKYRIACAGETDLVDFLKAFLCVPDAFNYVNGVWVKRDNAETGICELENVKDYFKGDFSEIRDAIALQPNNKVKLLYGIRTTDEGKQYQVIASKGGLILPNSANGKAIERLQRNLVSAKQGGAFRNVEFRIQELQEYTVEPTNLEKAPAATAQDGLPFAAEDSNKMPWD